MPKKVQFYPSVKQKILDYFFEKSETKDISTDMDTVFLAVIGWLFLTL